jgi:MFS family permease
VLNLAFVAVAVALLNSAFPVFAKNEVGVSEDAIGLLFLLNSLLIVGAQLPVARAVEGRRRVRGLALMCLVAAAGWLLVEFAGIAGRAAAALPLLVLAIAFVSAGECLYDSIYGPLVADLAPEGRTGRYMAASGFAWQLGFIAAPAAAGGLLSVAPFALWPVVAAAAVAAAVYALRVEPLLPDGTRRTPRRELRPSKGPLSPQRSAPGRPAASASGSASPRPPRR